MGHRIASLLLGSLLLRRSGAVLSDFVRLENDGGDALKPNQPLLAARDGRFIRFDTSETEIELELGVAVPFLKIPLKASHGAPAEHGPPDNRVVVNPAGVLVGATLLFTSFLLVPWLLPTGKPPTHRYVDKHYGDGGRGEGGGPGGPWALVREVDQLLTASNLDPRACPLKAACMLGHQLTPTLPALLDTVLRIDAVKQMTGASDLMHAIHSGSCDEAYPTCFLTQQTMALIPQLLGYR